ncbi:MAG: DNA-processing protein DprA [Chloroflexi bacterium]|nr:DNA-processing protein DprA [Chloroflexota bacterium]
MNNPNIYTFYKLLHTPRVGPVLANRIVNLFKNYQLDISTLVTSDLSTHPLAKNILAKQQLEFLANSDTVLQNQIYQLIKKGAGFITISDAQYPSLLFDGLNDASPPILSYLGNKQLLDKFGVGFCGSRNASDRGLNVAQDCATQLSMQDITVISGYANGIDKKTHYATLESGGETIIVLPQGLLNFHIHNELKSVWDWERVLVISEFCPADNWSVGRAMQRNKTIVGLSSAMILIEARSSGGSLDAGKQALAMNRKLYVPIYEGMPDFAEGNDILLNRGAIPLRKSKDNGRANLSEIISRLVTTEQNQQSNQLSLL